MKTIIACVVFIVSLSALAQVKAEARRRIVLPNPKLVRCSLSDCYQLWEDQPPNADDLFPEKVEVGPMNQPCPFGVLARYNKSASFEDLQAALEKKYGKGDLKRWTKTPMMVWHAQQQKLIIVLETVDKRMAKAQRVEVGTKNVIFTDSEVPTKCASQ